jgi:hypothetical protein
MSCDRRKSALAERAVSPPDGRDRRSGSKSRGVRRSLALDAQTIDALLITLAEAVVYGLACRAAGGRVAAEVVAPGPFTRIIRIIEVATGATATTLTARGARMATGQGATDWGIRDTAAAVEAAKLLRTGTDAGPGLTDPAAAAGWSRQRLTLAILADLLAVLPLAFAFLAFFALAAFRLALAGLGRGGIVRTSHHKQAE